MPVVWEKFPVRIVAREGQQNEFVTNAFLNVIPWSTRSDCTCGIAQRVSKRWSSVRIRTMFGRFVVATDAVPAPFGGGSVVPPPIDRIVEPPWTTVVVAVGPLPAIPAMLVPAQLPERWPMA